MSAPSNPSVEGEYLPANDLKNAAAIIAALSSEEIEAFSNHLNMTPDEVIQAVNGFFNPTLVSPS